MKTPSSIVPTQHCALCIHSKRTFQSGPYCGLTTAAPAFDDACDKAQFGQQLEKQVLETNLSYKRVTYFSRLIWVILVTLLAFGIACAAAGYAVREAVTTGDYVPAHVRDMGGVIMLMVFAFGGAALAVSIGLSAFVGHRTSLAHHRKQKQQLDVLLQRYGISYDFKAKVRLSIWGIKRIEHQLIMHPIPQCRQ